jgi:hypothetical protein
MIQLGLQADKIKEIHKENEFFVNIRVEFDETWDVKQRGGLSGNDKGEKGRRNGLNNQTGWSNSNCSINELN